MKILRSENLWVRSVGVWLVGMAILFIAWTLSFRSLPEGIVQGSFVIQYIPLETEEVFATFVRIFLWNLAVGCVPIVVANIVQIKGFSLGYILAFYHWAMYGVLLGTNSFKIPGLDRIFPSLVTLFSGSGIYEITAYTLISSATYGFYLLDEKGLIGKKVVKTKKWGALKLSKDKLGFIIFAVLLLAISNYFEAWNAFPR